MAPKSTLRPLADGKGNSPSCFNSVTWNRQASKFATYVIGFTPTRDGKAKEKSTNFKN
jgi:hypothetical protein